MMSRVNEVQHLSQSAVKSTKVTSPYDCNIVDLDVKPQTNLMIDYLFIY